MVQRYLGILGAAVAVVAIAVGIGFARQSRQLRAELQDVRQRTPEPVPDEVTPLIEKVRTLVNLPADEKPAVSPVSGLGTAGDHPLLAKAEQGDTVLIYLAAGRAYLYRPSTQEVIAVATLNVLPSVTGAEGIEAKVVLRNATDVRGLARRTEDIVKQLFPKVTVTARDNANVSNVERTIIIDLTGTRAADAERIARALAAEVGTLPDGEPAPTGADFLLLLGKDMAARALPSPSPSPSPEASPSPTPSPTP